MSTPTPTPPDQNETTIMQTDDPLFFDMGGGPSIDPYAYDDPDNARRKRGQGDLSHLPFFDHRASKSDKGGKLRT